MGKSTKLQILVVRAGSTEYDRQRRVQGTLDVPLSADGRAELGHVVEELRDHEIDAIYVSPNQSSTESAEMLADALDLKSKKLDKLYNLDQGLWQGMLIEDVKTKQPKVYRQWQEQPETVCPPGGETVASAKQRIVEVLERIVKKHKGGTVALVVPDPLASIICHVLRRDELNNLWECQSNGTRCQWITVVPDLLRQTEST